MFLLVNLMRVGKQRLKWFILDEKPAKRILHDSIDGVFSMKRRVVVTGAGVLSPAGNNVNTFWSSMVNGVSTASIITKFDTSDYRTRFACQIQDFDPTKHGIDKKNIHRMDKFIQYAVGAALEAMQSSGLDMSKENPWKVGVMVGSGIGGLSALAEVVDLLREKGPGKVSPFCVPMIISNMASGQISINWGLKGPSGCFVTACATGNNCIGESFRFIQYGDADVMLAGGTEAAITPLGMSAFCAARAMSTRNDDPKGASRPFDKNRDGFVMGEGSGVVVLEELEHAKRRGAVIMAEIAGYGLSSDAHHITAPLEDGAGAAVAMSNALKDAEMNSDQIDYINAHGTSTPAGDIAETKAIKTTFNVHAVKLSISSNKSMIGHLMGAAGGVECIATILTIRNGLIPPTINQEETDPQCDLDYVPNRAKEKVVNAALSNSFGFGGHNAVIAIKKFLD